MSISVAVVVSVVVVGGGGGAVVAVAAVVVVVVVVGSVTDTSAPRITATAATQGSTPNVVVAVAVAAAFVAVVAVFGVVVAAVVAVAVAAAVAVAVAVAALKWISHSMATPLKCIRCTLRRRLLQESLSNAIAAAETIGSLLKQKSGNAL